MLENRLHIAYLTILGGGKNVVQIQDIYRYVNVDSPPSSVI